MLIGITGTKRSGKDTIAKYLIENYKYEKYSFAEPLKKGICCFFGWDFDEVEKDENKEKIDPIYGISYRQACQHIGTDWAQYQLGKTFPLFKEITGRKLWVKRFIQFYLSRGSQKNIVIPDIRFPHEIDAIRALGGKIIRVTRDTKLNDIHESEKHIMDLIVDHNIENNFTIEDLYENINTWYKINILGKSPFLTEQKINTKIYTKISEDLINQIESLSNIKAFYKDIEKSPSYMFHKYQRKYWFIDQDIKTTKNSFYLNASNGIKEESNYTKVSNEEFLNTCITLYPKEKNND